MRNPEGETDRHPLRPCFDRRLKLEFHGSRVTCDAGLLAYREHDDALRLTALAGEVLADSRTGRNGWHGIVGLLRQSVYPGELYPRVGFIVRRRTYRTKAEARKNVFDYIEMFYNPKRKHTRNGMLSPVNFERQQKTVTEGV